MKILLICMIDTFSNLFTKVYLVSVSNCMHFLEYIVIYGENGLNTLVFAIFNVNIITIC